MSQPRMLRQRYYQTEGVGRSDVAHQVGNTAASTSVAVTFGFAPTLEAQLPNSPTVRCPFAPALEARLSNSPAARGPFSPTLEAQFPNSPSSHGRAIEEAAAETDSNNTAS